MMNLYLDNNVCGCVCNVFKIDLYTCDIMLKGNERMCKVAKIAKVREPYCAYSIKNSYREDWEVYCIL